MKVFSGEAQPGLGWKADLAVASCRNALLGVIAPSLYSSTVNGYDGTFWKPSNEQELDSPSNNNIWDYENKRNIDCIFH